MILAERDPALRRFERDTILACLAMAVLALIATAPAYGAGVAARVAAGVLGGGLLMALSYRAIKGAADVLATVAAGQALEQDTAAQDQRPEQNFSPAQLPVLSRGRKAFLAVKFFARFALLAIAAYVMLTCFRLHPVGLAAGVTSPVVSAAWQAGRMLRATARRRRP